jgi:Mg-chelatase subunit ChlD
MTEPAGGQSNQRTREQRWRLLLGEPADESLGTGLSSTDQAMDGALAALYDAPEQRPDGPQQPRSAGLGGSAPRVSRWLGDIRSYFPASVVQVMQRDAIERLNLTALLLEPELLESLEPDVHLVGTLLSLNRVMPETTKSTARQVVATVVVEIERRIAQQLRSSISGALNRSARTRRPKQRDIDWNATIAANLAHYLPEQHTVVPERLVGYGRRQQAVERDVVLAIDQSGSMAASVVYAAVFGAVLASIRSLKTSLVVFDTAVVDLTDLLDDPVDVLFGTQLGGGTDINRAIAYCQTLITRPADTLFVLISDLFEGGVKDEMLKRIVSMRTAGVQVVVLLALSDEGAPGFDRENAGALAALGVPAFACTPDAFPELLAVAVQRGDIAAWVEQNLTDQPRSRKI